jgi:tetratricopeptide (TPR) repeat protein
MALAEALTACGEHADAMRCIATWKEEHPDDPQPLLFESRIAYAQNRFEEGLARSKAAIARRPALVSARSWQVKNLIALGRHGEALEVIDETLEEALNPIPLLLERAEIIAHLEGDQAALDYLQPFAENYPASTSMLAAIANLHSGLGNLPEAIRACRAALRAPDEQATAVQKGRLHVQLAALLRKSGQLDQALHHLAQAVQHAPGLLEAHLESGEIHRLRREPEKAMEAFRRAMAIAPRDTRAYIAAGEILREGRDFTGAEDLLKRASRLAPDDSNIRRQLGAVIALNLVHSPQGLD